MKTLSKIFFTIILLGFVCLNITCSDQRYFVSVTYEGYVFDSTGGKPIPNATISLSTCHYADGGRNQCASVLIGSSTTDASGHFYIHEKASRLNRYFVRCNKSSLIGADDVNGDWLKNPNNRTWYVYKNH